MLGACVAPFIITATSGPGCVQHGSGRLRV